MLTARLNTATKIPQSPLSQELSQKSPQTLGESLLSEQKYQTPKFMAYAMKASADLGTINFQTLASLHSPYQDITLATHTSTRNPKEAFSKQLYKIIRIRAKLIISRLEVPSTREEINSTMQISFLYIRILNTAIQLLPHLGSFK